MKSYTKRFKEYAESQHLFPSGQQVLLAVSGGRDSVCLAHLMHDARLPFAIAHVNFRLRGADSDRDQRFVQQLARQLQCLCHVATYDTRAYAAEHDLGIEEAARRLRYRYFASLCRSQGYACLATAHHRDDSVETFFLNLFRGTGIAGLHGIRPCSMTTEWNDEAGAGLTVVRPMLCFSRADIDAMVASEGYAYVDDITNSQLDARRNQIRLQLMPLLRRLYPSVDDTMQANIERLAEVEEVYNAAVGSLRHRLLQPYRSSVPTLPVPLQSIPLDPLPAPRRTILYELLHPYGANDAILDALLRGGLTTGKHFQTPTHDLVYNRGTLLVGRRVPPVEPILVESEQPYVPDDTAGIYVDADLLARPLSLRLWQPGDTLYPFGLSFRRKVSDVLKDKKISLIEKQHVWALVDAEGRLVWLVGVCQDNRFRLTGSTRRVLRLALKA